MENVLLFSVHHKHLVRLVFFCRMLGQLHPLIQSTNGSNADIKKVRQPEQSGFGRGRGWAECVHTQGARLSVPIAIVFITLHKQQERWLSQPIYEEAP